MTTHQEARNWPGKFLDEFEEIVACLALIVVVLAVSWGVVSRYITEQPAAWASEIATLGFAWVVFFGAAACIKYKLHPSIDMLVNRMSKPWQAVVRWMNHGLVVGFCIFMASYGAQFAWVSWDNPSPVLRWPMTFLYGPVAFCFALMAIRYVQVARRGTWAIEAERETYVG